MKWVLLTALAAALIGCVKESKPVLEVGQFQFTSDDVARRKKVLQYYYPNEANINAAADLARYYSKLQVALDMGFGQLRERVIAEEKRIDSTTLDPQGLARMKRIFDNDAEAYRRLYIVPILAPKIVTELAQRDRQLQAKSRAKIEAFLKDAEAAPRRFTELAKRHGLVRRALRVSEANGVRFDEAPLPDDGRGLANEDVSPVLTERWREGQAKMEKAEAQKWVREIAVTLKPGSVSAKLMDKGDRWVAIKLLGTDKKSGDLLFECAEVTKDAVEPWIEEQTKKVKIVGG